MSYALDTLSGHLRRWTMSGWTVNSWRASSASTILKCAHSETAFVPFKVTGLSGRGSTITTQ